MKKIIFSIFFYFTFCFASFAQVTVIFQEGTTKQQKKTVLSGLKLAENSLAKRFGFTAKEGTTLFAGNDANWLAKNYVKFRKFGSVSQKTKAFEAWISGEAVYRGIFLNLGSKNYKNPKSLRGGIVHELFHVFQYELTGPKSKRCCNPERLPVVGPTWLMEGAASYFHASVEPRNFRGYFSYGRKKKSDIKSVGLAGLETFKGMNAYKDGYPITAYAVSKLVEDVGEDALIAFYKKVGQGTGWKQAFWDSFGVTPEQFYQSF